MGAVSSCSFAFVVFSVTVYIIETMEMMHCEFSENVVLKVMQLSRDTDII